MKKYLLILIGLAFFLAPKVHAATFVIAQTGVYGTSTTTNTTSSCTFANNPATGDVVIVGLYWHKTGQATSTIVSLKDGNNNSFAISPSSPSGNDSVLGAV